VIDQPKDAAAMPLNIMVARRAHGR
jgi:hypothetical protein